MRGSARTVWSVPALQQAGDATVAASMGSFRVTWRTGFAALQRLLSTSLGSSLTPNAHTLSKILGFEWHRHWRGMLRKERTNV